ncbi:MAG: 4Fe-4S binding protein [Candidatus Omnitrophota bacterium]
MKKLVLLRRSSQVFFLGLFIYILWSTTYPLKGALHPDTFFKASPLIILITSISQRIVLNGTLLCLILIALTLILGRFFCGWVCPLGTTIDGMGALRQRGLELKDGSNKRLSRVKYIILTAIILLALVGTQAAWILDPIVIMARFVSLNLIPTITLLVDKAFQYAIRATDFYEPLQDLYRALKGSVLGAKTGYFPNSTLILILFLFISAGPLFLKRFWCRGICPLGALYSLAARYSPLERIVDECTKCGICRSRCRTGAIREDMSYSKSECVLCMDCVYSCKPHVTRFGMPIFKGRLDRERIGRSGISRRGFLFLLGASSLFLTGLINRRGSDAYGASGVIRPPAALKEEEFVDRCVRCGNCMKVCITNGLQPVFMESGISGIWTPRLVPEIGHCEHLCTLCGNTCPTGAIPRLTLKKKKTTRLGTAKIDTSICIPWSQNRECIVCEEHCPIPDKAIKLKMEMVGGKIIAKPYIDISLCVGCGICQNKCPVRPERAVKVYPFGAYRTGS